MQERDASYWQAIVEHVRSSLEKRANDISEVLRIPKDKLEFRFVVGFGTEKKSPEVRIDATRSVVTVDFPEGYFRHFDHAVQWMVANETFRSSTFFGILAPGAEYSRVIHRIWSEWILQHELGHVLCGHLQLQRTSSMVEFSVADSSARVSPALRRALEFDADYFAARVFFSVLAGITKTSEWHLFFGLKDRKVDAPIALHDIGMMFVPLFAELDHLAGGTKSDSTHPPVFERISCFCAAGLKGYSDRVGDALAKEHWSVFMAGIRDGLVAAAIYTETMATRPRTEPDIDEYRRILRQANVHGLRMFRLRDDWLTINVPTKGPVRKKRVPKNRPKAKRSKNR